MVVFDALIVMLLVAVGIVVVFGCLGAFHVFRESGRHRRVVRVGRHTQAKCVRSYDKVPQPAGPQAKGHPPPKKRFVFEFPGPDGDLVRFESTLPPEATRVGDKLTVAHLPDQPASAVVVATVEKSAVIQSLRILAGFCVFLVVMAGIAVVGVLIIQGYASGAGDPNSGIEP
ncbi:DUF3592 domain-containing protein [Streptomyces sp. NPDC002580]|uniref:DUF3592 domain-containing protein n=1 Tax=Streptomyces sp. NPDC002580 TaxID=3364653 RepID=UPI0036747A48